MIECQYIGVWTKEVETEFFWLSRVALFVGGFGLVGNALTLVVLIRSHLRKKPFFKLLRTLVYCQLWYDSGLSRLCLSSELLCEWNDLQGHLSYPQHWFHWVHLHHYCCVPGTILGHMSPMPCSQEKIQILHPSFTFLLIGIQLSKIL